jgi:hypothetical protein
MDAAAMRRIRTKIGADDPLPSLFALATLRLFDFFVGIVYFNRKPNNHHQNNTTRTHEHTTQFFK